MLNIRSATPSDSDNICAFIHELAEFEQLADQCKASPERIAQALFSEPPHAEALIAEVEGQAVGFALFFHNFSTFEAKRGLYLEDLYVRPLARGTGVGTALLQALAQLAVARDCARMEWSVLDWNARAIRFYEHLGAALLPDWRINRLTGAALKQLAERPQ